jgi:hypothetical protein
MTAMYTHLSAAFSVGKCPRALTGLRIRAFTLSIVIWSWRGGHGCDLRVRGVDVSLTEAVSRARWSRNFFLRRCVSARSAGCVGSVLAEGFSECVAESTVVRLQLSDALEGDVEALPQRGVRGGLAVGDALTLARVRLFSEPLNVGAQIWLGVEPGAGDVRLAVDRIEGDGKPAVVHVAESGDGSTVGGLRASLCGGGEVARVVSPHRRSRRRGRRLARRGGWW